MEQNLDSKINNREKIILFFRYNKLKIIFVLIFITVAISFYIFSNIQSEKKNILISEKYIQAGLLLANNDSDNSKKIYESIIESKNKFYSILSLNMILEKNLEKNQEKILKYFSIVESVKLSKEQKELLKFKKALYLIKISKNDEGKKILKELEETDSNLKNLFKEILDK